MVKTVKSEIRSVFCCRTVVAAKLFMLFESRVLNWRPCDYEAKHGLQGCLRGEMVLRAVKYSIGIGVREIYCQSFIH